MNKRTFALKRRREPGSVLASGLKGLAALPLITAGSWMLYSHLAIDHNLVLPDALPVERKYFPSQTAGRLSYYLNRQENERPLVLLHSINAAASAYEMRPLFLHYHPLRPVYALDLPGFGFSERANREYSPSLYKNAIIEFLQSEVGQPADVVALSLSSEFAAMAAMDNPDLFNSLVLISPSGFSLGKEKRSSQQVGKSGLGDIVHSAFSVPLWARPFYDLLTTRASIEYFLQQSFIGQVPADLISYDYATAHQRGAEHAPLYFVSGKLFTSDIRTSVYERLQVPTLVLYDRDNFVRFDMLPETLAQSSFWQAVRLIPSLGLPHFEQTENTAEVLDQFWK